MRDHTSIPGFPVNASPVAEHRRQMLWQVWAPIVGVLVVVLVLMVLAIIGTVQGSPQINRWGNLSAVLIILPVLLTMLLFVIIVGALVYGLNKLLKRMPDWMLKLQLHMMHISIVVRRASDAATKPVMKANTLSARIQAFWGKIFGKR